MKGLRLATTAREQGDELRTLMAHFALLQLLGGLFQQVRQAAGGLRTLRGSLDHLQTLLRT